MLRFRTMITPNRLPPVAALALAALLAGCQTTTDPSQAGLAPQDALSVARKAVPPGVKDAAGWASDIQTSFSLLGLPATRGSCAPRWPSSSRNRIFR